MGSSFDVRGWGQVSGHESGSGFSTAGQVKGRGLGSGFGIGIRFGFETRVEVEFRHVGSVF